MVLEVEVVCSGSPGPRGSVQRAASSRLRETWDLPSDFAEEWYDVETTYGAALDWISVLHGDRVESMSGGSAWQESVNTILVIGASQ